MTFGTIIFQHNDTAPLKILDSHFTISKTKEIPYIYLSNEKTFSYFYMNAFVLRFNYTFDWNYVIFTCKSSKNFFFRIPLDYHYPSFNLTNQQYIFEEHDKIHILSKTEKSHCYRHGYQVTDFSISKEFSFLYFTNILMLILLLGITIYFRNSIPLSTRNSIPFIAIGLFCLESINTILYIISSTFEFVYHYGCFFEGAFYVPARMTLIILFIFVS